MTVVILIAIIENFAIAMSKSVGTNKKLYAYNSSKYDHL